MFYFFRKDRKFSIIIWQHFLVPYPDGGVTQWYCIRLCNRRS
jgi:hypothetical protein